MNGSNARARLADHALAAFLAPSIEGRRVAVVGPGSADVAKRFRALGASTVVAFGGNGEGVAVRPLVPGTISAFQSRLDCLVVPDASEVPLSMVLDEARYALGGEGLVVVVSRPAQAPTALESVNGLPAGPGYYPLMDALSSRFGHVRMVARGAFIAYAMASLDGTGEGFELDTRLLPDEAERAEAFIALASDTEPDISGMALVQVPTAEILASVRGLVAKDPALEKRVQELEAELARREAKQKEQDTTAAERWVKLQRLEHDHKALEEDARKARDRAVRLSKELDDERKLRQRVEIETQMSRKAPEPPRADPEELVRANERAHGVEKENVSLRLQIRALEAELDETRSTESGLREMLDESERIRDEMGHRLAKVRATPSIPPPPVVVHTKSEPPKTSTADADLVVAQSEQQRLETDLRRVAQENAQLQSQIRERDAAIRELSFAVARASESEAEQEVQRLRSTHAEALSLHAALTEETARLVEENEILRQRIVQLEFGDLLRSPTPRAESESTDAVERVAQLEHDLRVAQERAKQWEERAKDWEKIAPVQRADDGRVKTLEAEVSRLSETLQAHAGLHRQLEQLRKSNAELEARLETERRQNETWSTRSLVNEKRESQNEQSTVDLEAALQPLRRRLEDERERVSHLQRSNEELRLELSTQLALLASTEDRASQRTLELEGARAGYARRVRELEHEVEQLLQALEVVGSAASDDEDVAHVRYQREIELIRAELHGTKLRLAEAERAVETLRSQPTPRMTDSASATAELRAEEILADLAETAARLATTEDALQKERDTARDVVARLEAAQIELRQVRSAPAEDPRLLQAMRQDLAERDALARTMSSQLEDREVRLRGMERRMIEEIERARRTESEIWETELRARDQRIALLAREVERLRVSDDARSQFVGGVDVATEIRSLRATLESREREVHLLRGAINQVRMGLSAILVDGRGAVIAHDLVSLLRQIEDPG